MAIQTNSSIRTVLPIANLPPMVMNIQNVTTSLTTQYKNVMPVSIQNIDTVVKTESSSLTSLNLGGLGAMEQLYIHHHRCLDGTRHFPAGNDQRTPT